MGSTIEGRTDRTTTQAGDQPPMTTFPAPDLADMSGGAQPTTRRAGINLQPIDTNQ